METTHHDPTRRDEPEFDLYTIPSYSSWFAWDNIHETESAALREFFDGSSISRTPKIYKEYRDFIINKYREDPSRRLTFTEIRKSLVGDVNLLNKVFRFLDNSGLINFAAAANSARYDDTEKQEKIDNFRVEEGPPNGIRVVAMPNSLKPLSVLPQPLQNSEVVENVLKLPPLASHSNVFGKQKASVCGNCGENCSSGWYECSKGDYILCTKCFNNGSYGQNNSKDDYKFNNDSSVVVHSNGAVWTEAETLLLLESVLKHGDDWDLVVQDVQTKTKLECISKLIELPFGDLILSSTRRNGDTSGPSGNDNNPTQVPLASSEKQNTLEINEGLLHEEKNVSEQNGDAAYEGPPLKRKRTASLSDAGGSLMKQVAVISTMAGPDVASAAAEAAVAALCEETSCPREIFGGKEDFPTKGLWSLSLHSEPERILQDEDTEIKERPAQSENEETSLGQNDIPLTLRLRTAIATSLGAAAAHAKLLADEEDREIENLVTTIVETQMKKLQYKIKHFDNLELIMEKEHAELEELKESFIEERVDVVQRAITSGMSKWRDHSSARPHSGSVF